MIGIRLWREGSKGGGRAAAERLGSEIGIEDRGSLPGNRHPERQRRILVHAGSESSLDKYQSAGRWYDHLSRSPLTSQRTTSGGMKRVVKNLNHFFAALFVCLYFVSMAAGSLLHGHLEGSFMSSAGPRGVSTKETLGREISCRHALAAMRE